jgi:hypothetical protein
MAGGFHKKPQISPIATENSRNLCNPRLIFMEYPKACVLAIEYVAF